MNELNMAIYTGKNEENKVTLTASFNTHEEAVAFHTGLADLCKQHSMPQLTGRPGGVIHINKPFRWGF